MVREKDFREVEDDLVVGDKDLADARKDRVPAMKDLRCTRYGDVSCDERLVIPSEEGSFPLQNIVVLHITPRGVESRANRPTARPSRAVSVSVVTPLRGGDTDTGSLAVRYRGGYCVYRRESFVFSDTDLLGGICRLH